MQYLGGSSGPSSDPRVDHRPRADQRPLPLTPRQLEIVRLVALGHTNREIGSRLGIRPATVKRHLERIYDRVGARTRTAVAAQVLLAVDPSRPWE